ncbi:MAG: Mov34/MPN/PAD-1 family protein [Candidatus Helarchaeota archaeon]
MIWEKINKFRLVEPSKPEVVLSLKAIKKIMLHVIEYSNSSKKRWQWKEVIGLLGGKIGTKNKVYVSNSYAINHGSKYHVGYQKQNYISAAIINDILSSRDEFFVGWYHSHPGIGFFYSETDVINHIGYQDVNPQAIGLVFDHEGYKKSKKFFEIYNLNYSLSGAIGYDEIDYVIKEIPKDKELEILKEIYDRIFFYWRINLVESAEKSVKKWIQHVKYK